MGITQERAASIIRHSHVMCEQDEELSGTFPNIIHYGSSRMIAQEDEIEDDIDINDTIELERGLDMDLIED